ncbi:hypothetical protein ACHAW5_005470 [Stephanodiscus triporus]|uniref:Uncharacterized protein n=1 Tax=Stephanodiscus triporus TaxID=2934178 RepID=A0ABD3QFK1_9STRA
MTGGMIIAETSGMYFSLLTAYMEVMDNIFRMIQQHILCLLDKTRPPLGWYDWGTATGLVACVSLQAMMHFRRDRTTKQAIESLSEEDCQASKATIEKPSRESLAIGISVLAVVILTSFLCGALLGGVLGQVYVLGSIATLAKTFAWWIGQYPFMKNRSFLAKWLAGWSIAGVLEYLPLMGAMLMGQRHGVNLALLTAYMEAMDNWMRDLQMRALGKPVYWYDAAANCGMALFVMFGGVASYYYRSEVNTLQKGNVNNQDACIAMEELDTGYCESGAKYFASNNTVKSVIQARIQTSLYVCIIYI